MKEHNQCHTDFLQSWNTQLGCLIPNKYQFLLKTLSMSWIAGTHGGYNKRVDVISENPKYWL